MSIANEIQRLQSAKANIKSAIEEKGVTVGDGTIDTYAEKIAEISGGGSGLPTNVSTQIITPASNIDLNALKIYHNLSAIPHFAYIVNLDTQKIVDNFDSVDQITLSVSANRLLQEGTTKNGTGTRFWLSKSRGANYDYIDYTNNTLCEMTNSYIRFTNGVLHGGYSYMVVILA